MGPGVAEGTAVAQQLASNHGLHPESSVGFSLTGGGEGGGFARGSTVTATATVSVPGILVPGVGYVGWAIQRHPLLVGAGGRLPELPMSSTPDFGGGRSGGA